MLSCSRVRVLMGMIVLLLAGLGLLIADNGPNHQVRTLSLGKPRRQYQ